MCTEKIIHCSAIMDGTGTLKFTVNQIVLLQRLKQTGLDKGQILKGLEEIEKLEDTGFGGASVSIATAVQNSNANTPPDIQPETPQFNGGSTIPPGPAGRENDSQRNSVSPPSPRAKFNHNNILHPLGQPNPLMFGAHLQNPNQLSLLPPVASWPSSSQAVAVATAASLLQNGFAHSAMPHSIYPNLINGRSLVRSGSSSGCGASTTVVDINDEKVDITDELEELFRRDQAAVKEEIRKFINERHISQSAIAKATKNAISQSYISQWLAQPQDISGQKKKAMYTWYLTERRKSPHGALPLQSLSFRGCENEQDAMNPMLLRTKRGARFTWPKECLAVLESFYNSNSYPDECMREKIAHSCNSIIQSHKPGMMISELDKVTTVKVYNWFANRRKDDKRRRHIEQVENLSNQQHILSPRNSTVSPTPSCDSNESHRDVDGPMAASEKSEQHVKKEEAMAIALEMEAVNRSILSLVQPHSSPSVEEEDDHESSYGGARTRERINHFQNLTERLTECRSFAG